MDKEQGFHPPTEAELAEIRNGRPLTDCLPLTNARGRELCEITLNCARCGAEIEQRNMRMRVNRWGDTYEIRGWGVCKPCRTATPLLLRWLPDGSLAGPHPRTQEWVCWPFIAGEKARPWWDLAGRLQGWLARWWR